MSFATVAGPITGALVGGLMSDGSSGGQQVSKDPWGPTQKPLTDMVNDGTDLYHYYQQNPFNQIQQTAYQNLFGDLDAFRGQNSGLMDFANRLMGTNYSRTGGQQIPMGAHGGSAVGMGGMGGMGGGMGGGQGMDQGLAGLLGAIQAQRGQPGQGMQSGGLLGPFSLPAGQSYGKVDFTALNPWTNGGIKPNEKPMETDDEKARRLRDEEEQARRNSGEYYRGEGA